MSFPAFTGRLNQIAHFVIVLLDKPRDARRLTRSWHIRYSFTSALHTDTYQTIAASKCNQRGRAVLITGASKGIGRASAISFAKAGASAIAVGARSSVDGTAAAVVDAAKASGHAIPQVLKLTLDVADAESVAKAALKTEQAFSRLDILVNNAGQMDKWLHIADTDPQDGSRHGTSTLMECT